MNKDLCVQETYLGDLCEFTQGVQIPASETIKELQPGFIRYIYIRDLFIDKFPVFVKDIYPQKILKESDIIMVNTGATAGDVYRGKRGVLCNNAFTIKIKHESTEFLDLEFLWYFLNSEQKDHQLRRLFNSAGQPHVGHGNIAKLKILLFPISEQRKIATILYTWDEAITLTQKLIAALQQRKKGLMQRLLSGEVRFPGFEDEWEEVSLGEMGIVTNGGTPDSTKPDYWDGSIDWTTPSEITALSTKYIEHTQRHISEMGLAKSSAVLIPPYSILVCTRATIGELAINLVPMATNQGFKNLTPNENYNPEYIYYLLKSNKHKIVRYANGSTFLELSKKDFMKLKFSVPQKHEQENIANILNECDKEIETYQHLKEKIQHQKKGLMQRLLTGKVRVN